MNREELLYKLEELIEELKNAADDKGKYIDLSDEIEELLNQLDKEGKEELLDSLENEEDWILDVVRTLCD